MALLGNPSMTGCVSYFDYHMTRDIYAAIMTGQLVNNLLTQDQRTAMDVDKSGTYDSSDASSIGVYAKYLYNEGSMSYEDWYDAGCPSYDT